MNEEMENQIRMYSLKKHLFLIEKYQLTKWNIKINKNQEPIYEGELINEMIIFKMRYIH